MTGEDIIGAYIECALWSSTDQSDESGGNPLDDNYSPDDLAPEARASMLADCDDFLDYCDREGIELTTGNADMIGHDFWLTRNHHGAGFWDRGLGALGNKLTDIAHSYGESYVYVGDDGRLYV